MVSGVGHLLKANGVTVVNGTGRFAGPNTFAVEGAEPVNFKHAVIATGSHPLRPPVEGIDHPRCVDSTGLLAITEIPKRLIVLGGGVIGVEFASMLSDMGSEVTIIEALPRILAPTDEEIGKVVARSFKKRGVNVQAGARLTGIEGAAELTLTWDAGAGEQSAVVDKLIVSIGRGPNTKGIGLEDSGVHVDERGFVGVDGNLRTSMPGVYAAGDVVDTPALAHVGFAEAIVIVKTILGEAVTPVDYEKVPWVVYSQPEVAWCGLTEAEARERGHDVVVSTHRFAGDARAMIIGETEGLVKLVTDTDGLLLGVHIVGPWATELLGEGYLAVNWEANAADLAALIHPHPTLSEVLGEAALALTGRALH
jgi:dihydrolipoamide dehydrogenase